jgi:hypothetical protein
MPRFPKRRASYALVCVTELGIELSSELESEAWDANETLVELLNVGDDDLFAWKKPGSSHLANSRETYAWRKVIDSIKTANLEDLTPKVASKRTPSSPLIKSKPIMLRVAGEITNSLLHSYNNRHRIAFVQCDSTRPSSVPT